MFDFHRYIKKNRMNDSPRRGIIWLVYPLRERVVMGAVLRKQQWVLLPQLSPQWTPPGKSSFVPLFIPYPALRLSPTLDLRNARLRSSHTQLSNGIPREDFWANPKGKRDTHQEKKTILARKIHKKIVFIEQSDYKFDSLGNQTILEHRRNEEIRLLIIV